MWMKGKNGIPAFLAALIFLVVQAVNIWGRVPQQHRVNFEIMSNAFMLIVAVVSFFWIGLPSKESSEGTIGNMLGNIAVSAIAFPMNIDVFQQTIRWEQFWKDIWNWHLFWIVCGVVQILFLSSLGVQLLERVQGILLWGEGVIKCLGGIFKDILDEIRKTEKRVKYAVIGGFIFWMLYLCSQIYEKGSIADVFFDMDFIWTSVRLWIAWLIFCLLMSVAPLLFQKITEAVQDIRRKWMGIVAIVIVFALSIVKWPILLTVIVIVSVVPMILIVLIIALIKTIYKKQSSKEQKDSGRMSQEPESEKLTDTIKWGDCVIVWIVFIVMPLTIISIVTFQSEGGREIAAQDWSQITTWLEFINAALGTTKALCEVFALF